jgi:hypothetical protein
MIMSNGCIKFFEDYHLEKDKLDIIDSIILDANDDGINASFIEKHLSALYYVGRVEIERRFIQFKFGTTGGVNFNGIDTSRAIEFFRESIGVMVESDIDIDYICISSTTDISDENVRNMVGKYDQFDHMVEEIGDNYIIQIQAAVIL